VDFRGEARESGKEYFSPSQNLLLKELSDKD
jgi:hypothetical protein